MDTPHDRESVCIARSAADEARIEHVLKGLGLDFIVRVEATERHSPGAVCFLAMIYSVARTDADRARRALAAAGLGNRLL